MTMQLDYTETSAEIDQIVAALYTLPSEKVTDVRDYVWFLQTRYRHSLPLDVSDEWSEEDIADLTSASLSYATHSFWTADDDND